ncbi:MAG: hypothetical protein CMJ42_12650 [Phyllobacteriaceae bacterium]|nr:hypothetical protein [Phyllobacteriaceae bacterium]MBA91781.1 hypothetical protein [Phyllobacteriaceae bacterium]
MKFLFLTGGLLLAATGVQAETLPNGTPIQQISASVFLLGAPAEPEVESAPLASAAETVEVAVVPTVDMTLDEIIGERPEVMNQPRSLADLGPSGEEDVFPGEDAAIASAAAGDVVMPEPDLADIDAGQTAAVNPQAAPEFPGMELRRE